MAPKRTNSSTGFSNTEHGAREQDAGDQNELAGLIGDLVGGNIDKKQMRRLAILLGGYVRIGRRGVRFNGKGLADLLLYIAPRLPARSAEQLRESYGVSGASLVGKVVKGASHKSAAVGGVTGALASAGQFAPPLWVALPAEILAETLLVTAVEMRLIVELHELFDMPIEGTQAERGQAILEAWTTRRGVDMEKLVKNGRGELERDHGVTKHLTGLVKRKLMARAMRNLGTLTPLFVGAAIGAETNRRSTRDIGNAIIRDLRKRTPTSTRSDTRK